MPVSSAVHADSTRPPPRVRASEPTALGGGGGGGSLLVAGVLSLVGHLLVLFAILVFAPPRFAEAAQPVAFEIHEVPAPLEETTPPEPEPEPPEPEPEEAPAPVPTRTPRVEEPPPPPAIMTADGPAVGSDWAHPAGSADGVIGGTGSGDTPATTNVALIEEPAPRRPTLNRAEMRRRVLGYVRGTLSSYLNGRIEYPLAARRSDLEGVVVLRLRLGNDGQILSVRLANTSGHDILDRAALAQVTNLRTMPAPPRTIPWDDAMEIPLPVVYRLR